MKTFGAARRVRVLLDAVIFQSGLIVGPDEGGLQLRYAAERRAVRDMLDELRGLPAQSPLALTGYLAPLMQLEPRLTLAVPYALRDADFHYQWMRKGLAHDLARSRSDHAAAIAYIGSVSAAFKELHR